MVESLSSPVGVMPQHVMPFLKSPVVSYLHSWAPMELLHHVRVMLCHGSRIWLCCEGHVMSLHWCRIFHSRVMLCHGRRTCPVKIIVPFISKELTSKWTLLLTTKTIYFPLVLSITFIFYSGVNKIWKNALDHRPEFFADRLANTKVFCVNDRRGRKLLGLWSELEEIC